LYSLVGRVDVIEKGGKRIGVDLLGKLSKVAGREATNRMPRTAGEVRRRAVDGKAASAGEPSPPMVVSRAVGVMPRAKLSIPVALPSVAEESPVGAFGTADETGISRPGADSYHRENNSGENQGNDYGGNLDGSPSFGSQLHLVGNESVVLQALCKSGASIWFHKLCSHVNG